MKRLSYVPRLLFYITALAAVSVAACLHAAEQTAQSAIPRVARMPNLPQPFAMRDWSQVTRDYIDLVFDFEQRGDHLPLVRWLDEGHTMVSFPSYVGGPHDPEAINYLAAVVSGSLVGLDMRNHRGHDWVTMGTNFFNADRRGLRESPARRARGTRFGTTFFPMFSSTNSTPCIREDPARDQQALTVAQKWHEACVALGGKTDPLALPNFDHTGLNLKTMQPVEKGLD